MGLSSTEKHTSGTIQRGTLQRLWTITNQQVYPSDNGDSMSNMGDKQSHSTIVRLSSTGTDDFHEYENDQLNTTHDSSMVLPFRNIIVKKNNHQPIEVLIRCIFLRVGEIDTLNERYFAELLLEASWEDKTLRGLPVKTFDPEKNWTPQLELINGIGEFHDTISYSVRYDQQGITLITEHHRLKATLWERMELYHFPVDIQALSVSITTAHTDSELIFVQNLNKPSGVNRQVFVDEQEWHLFEHVDIMTSKQIDEYLDTDRNHPVVTCSSHAARKFGYFIWNSYFLIFLITSASFATFPIPLANIHGRIQIACTLLLTSITFRWLCNKALPPISYLTAVDVYAIGSIFSLCLLNIYHGVIGYINYYKSENQSGPITSVQSIITIDRWALIVFTLLFFLYQLATLAWMYLVPLRKRRELFQRNSQSHTKTIKSKSNDPIKMT